MEKDQYSASTLSQQQILEAYWSLEKSIPGMGTSNDFLFCERTVQWRSLPEAWEWCGLHVGDFDRKQGILTVKGKGSKERRIALGSNCQRNLLYYLDQYRPDQEELAEWGSPDEDHLFLSETRLPLTKNGMTQLFARLKKRSGITGKRISPHILRHTFAINFLKLGRDPFSLQELLGHEDMATVKLYMHMNDDDIQEQKRRFSPGDHLPTRMPGPRDMRHQSGKRTGSGRKKGE